jgi:WD40 repeat protein
LFFVSVVGVFHFAVAVGLVGSTVHPHLVAFGTVLPQPKTFCGVRFFCVVAARSENALLKERVKELEEKCRILSMENETLQSEREALTVEVELYRAEAAASGSRTASNSAPIHGSAANVGGDDDDDDTVFCQSGNGDYPSQCEVTLEKLHDIANILSCALSADDTILATGGADSTLSLLAWGRTMSGDASAEDAANYCNEIVQTATKVVCSAPVIAVAFARHSQRFPLLAASCMDGSVQLVHYSSTITGSSPSSTLVAVKVPASSGGSWKHAKYVKSIAWSPTQPMVATASADGSVQLYKIQWTVGFQDAEQIQVSKVTSWQLSGPVEAIAFCQNYLFCYARGTPVLVSFDLDDAPNYTPTKINLNHGAVGTAAFDEHTSFAVMDIAVDYSSDRGDGAGGKYLALATDMNRNIILDWKQQRIVRNLYGHQNDGFSHPKVAWSKNGQYLFGNTQNEGSICVWDIASATIVQRLSGSHAQPIRDLYSSSSTNTLVSTSFDKKTNIWLQHTVE